MKKNYYIYIIYDIKYNKFYIGKRTTCKNIYEDIYFGSGKRISNIIKHYKNNNIDINMRLKKYILEVSKTQEDNDYNERKWIWFFDAINDNGFYNIHEGGNGGDTISGMNGEDYKEFCNKIKGRKHSIEFKNKMSRLRTGTTLSEETKNKISIKLSKENNPFYGKTHSDGFKEKMSKLMKERPSNMLGKTHSEEAKKKMSIAKKGKPSKRNKHVIMEFNGDIIEFNSQKECSKYLKEKYSLGLGIIKYLLKYNVEYEPKIERLKLLSGLKLIYK